MKIFWHMGVALTALILVYVGSNSPTLAVGAANEAVPHSSAPPREDRVPQTLTLIRMGAVSDLKVVARRSGQKNSHTPANNSQSGGDTNKLWVVDTVTGQIVSQYELEGPATGDNDHRNQWSALQSVAGAGTR